MPAYDFKCENCETEDGEDFVFEIQKTMSEFDGKAECPSCGDTTDKRIYTDIPVYMGLTAAHKRTGVTRGRFEKGKHMYDVRDRRKKAYGPGTREGDSNELHVGTEIRDGFLKM